MFPLFAYCVLHIPEISFDRTEGEENTHAFINFRKQNIKEIVGVLISMRNIYARCISFLMKVVASVTSHSKVEWCYPYLDIYYYLSLLSRKVHAELLIYVYRYCIHTRKRCGRTYMRIHIYYNKSHIHKLNISGEPFLLNFNYHLFFKNNFRDFSKSVLLRCEIRETNTCYTPFWQHCLKLIMQKIVNNELHSWLIIKSQNIFLMYHVSNGNPIVSFGEMMHQILNFQ